MANKFTYKNEVRRKWDVGSGTRPTQKQLKKKKKVGRVGKEGKEGRLREQRLPTLYQILQQSNKNGEKINE